MKQYLVITSIADQNHPILKQFATATLQRNIPFIVIGDVKSPDTFELKGCDFYSIQRQQDLPFKLAKLLPVKHYARKNLGYLLAISKGAEIISETDDDNLALDFFWKTPQQQALAHPLVNKSWVNSYKYFTEAHIWPRGFALEHIHDKLPTLEPLKLLNCPIQQGLADGNPDVDAIYRLTMPLPIIFNKTANIALGQGSICPFNSQNTIWFKDAFPLLYLPSYCSFRMTDIWRSFIAQRIAWTCGWSILFHQSTVFQDRNNHDLMHDFRDEITGYTHNKVICETLYPLKLKQGVENIPKNMLLCYQKLIQLDIMKPSEIKLLEAWLEDIRAFQSS